MGTSGGQSLKALALARYCWMLFGLAAGFAPCAAADKFAPAVSASDVPARWYSIAIEPRADRLTIRARDKWNPIWWFKNADDPLPPESYRPHDKGRALKWQLRNPLHNFTFYVIGVADKKVVRSGLRPEENFNSDGGWNVAATRHKWI